MLDPLGAVPVNGTLPSSFLASLSSNVNITTLSATPIYLLALIFLATSYPALAPAFPKTRQRAWILTTIAAAVMTFASLPFVLDYVKRGGVGGVLPRTDVAIAMNRFFQAYLTADLAVGFLFYRAQVGFLTGWVHHVVYIGIVEVAVRGGWARVFCLAGVMELPTLLLGLSTLFPALRSNVLFSLTFFATRICFHLLMMWDCFTRDHSSLVFGCDSFGFVFI
ncbi:hypothetical protein B0H14DRAFT_1119251 [Mycena olivaceomarginata]|nr:hypothetical protein B0H14DRAFT_1119251 [Mycena olivaceomarginata]